MKKSILLLLALCLMVPTFAQWSNLGSAGFTSGGVQYLQLDVRTGVPYVAFKDGGLGERATVMKYSGGSWSLVGTAGFSEGVARDQSIYVKGDRVYVAYSDDAHSDKPTVMYYTGSSWAVIGTPGFSYQASYLSLAMDDEELYLAFSGFVGGGYKTCVERYNSVTMMWDPIGSPGFSAGDAWYQKLVIEDGKLYVSYMDLANGNKMTVMTFNGTNWEPVGSEGFTPGAADWSSLAVDGTTPYVAYRDGANGNKVSVMKFDGSSWVNVGSAGFSEGEVYSASITIFEGKPIVTYSDLGIDTKTVVKQFDGTNWVNLGMANISEGNASTQTIAQHEGVFYVAYRDFFEAGKASVIQFDAGLSTTEIEKQTLSIYPNPVQNVLNILTESTIQKIEIVDLSGNKIYTGNQNTVSVEGFAAGIYLVQVTTELGTVTERFTKR